MGPSGRSDDGASPRRDGVVSPVDFSRAVVALYRDGSSSAVDAPSGPPLRVDGYTVGAPHLTDNPPHRGEMHPDGDELLYLIAGRINVILEQGGDQDRIGVEHVEALQPGEVLVVPKGVWHRVEVREPSHLLHITPGPGDGHRPL